MGLKFNSSFCCSSEMMEFFSSFSKSILFFRELTFSICCNKLTSETSFSLNSDRILPDLMFF